MNTGSPGSNPTQPQSFCSSRSLPIGAAPPTTAELEWPTGSESTSIASTMPSTDSSSLDSWPCDLGDRVNAMASGRSCLSNRASTREPERACPSSNCSGRSAFQVLRAQLHPAQCDRRAPIVTLGAWNIVTIVHRQNATADTCAQRGEIRVRTRRGRPRVAGSDPVTWVTHLTGHVGDRIDRAHG